MRQQYSDFGPWRASEVISFLEDHFLLEDGKPIKFEPLRPTVCFWTHRIQKFIARQAAIVQDAEAYQHLLDIPVEGIRQGIDDVAHRRTFPRRKTYLMTRKTSR
jgi:hypothetical protein